MRNRALSGYGASAHYTNKLAAMKMLPLDDQRWSELRSRNGDAAWVPERLKVLLQRPDDLPAFQDLWPWLCSEGTAWSGLTRLCLMLSSWRNDSRPRNASSIFT